MTYQNVPQYPGGQWALVPPPPPGTITAARIIGWIQGGLAAVSTAIIIIVTIVASNAVDRADSDTGGAFNDIGNDAIGILVAIIIVLAALTAAIIIPLTRLKPGHTSAGTGLVVVEGIFIVFDVIGLTGSGSKWVVVIAMAMSIAMIAALCSRSARLWLRTGQTATAPAMAPAQYGGAAGYGSPGLPPAAWPNPNTNTVADTGDAGAYTGPPAMVRPASGAAGQWAGDPYGRHQLRMYDGVQWTDWVSDHGSVSSDPIR